jgi:hypothetical protein
MTWRKERALISQSPKLSAVAVGQVTKMDREGRAAAPEDRGAGRSAHNPARHRAGRFDNAGMNAAW